MTAKPITSRACNEAPCLSLVGHVTFSTINLSNFGPMKIWVAYATDSTYNNYVLATNGIVTEGRGTATGDITKQYLLSDLGLTQDIPVEHRKRIFFILKTPVADKIGSFKMFVATHTAYPVYQRNIALYGGFTGVCTDDTLDTVGVSSFAHGSTLYTGNSWGTTEGNYNYCPVYTRYNRGADPSTGWSGYYYVKNTSWRLVEWHEGIASASQARPFVLAVGVDLYGVGF